MPRERQEYSDVRHWANVSGMIKEGQGWAHVRSEVQDHPCNQVLVPADVPLYTAKYGRSMDQFDKYCGFIEANGKKVIVAYGKTRAEVGKDVSFAGCYSQFAPSTYYRAFRTCYGFSYNTIPDYTTPALAKDGERKGVMMLMAMCGAKGQDLEKMADLFVSTPKAEEQDA